MSFDVAHFGQRGILTDRSSPPSVFILRVSAIHLTAMQVHLRLLRLGSCSPM
jgi:hypothetical protein